MLLQLQTIVKELSLASLQTEKTKNKESSSRQSAKGKAKPIKDKNMSANTLCCRHKGHVASNSLLDADTKSSSSNSLDLDEEVEEVVASS
jgi:hypothetical protein